MRESLGFEVAQSATECERRRCCTSRMQVMTQLTGSDWPYCDSSAPAAVAGEKDACGVGFLAQLQGERSHGVLQQAFRGLG